MFNYTVDVNIASTPRVGTMTVAGQTFTVNQAGNPSAVTLVSFTVDPGRFPEFPGLVADLKKQHLHLVLITDLHIAHVAGENYMPYETGHAGDHFVKKPDGSEFVGVVWPGDAVFPDFTRRQTRDWWGGLYKEFAQDGVAGFWNDMNEPAVFETRTVPIGRPLANTQVYVLDGQLGVVPMPQVA
jgi:alpha-glucosidase (family GH31 glycosyl hydrolase)